MRWLRVAIGLLLAWSLAIAPASNADTPLPTPPRGKGERCVEPTDVMRRDHMQFLLHQRDETMHRGVRTTKHSLVECLSCHTGKDAGGKYIPVNAPGQFCEVCHTYSAVSMDCFECHASKPRESAHMSTDSKAGQ